MLALLDFPTQRPEDRHYDEYTSERREGWDREAERRPRGSWGGRQYLRRLKEIYRYLIPEGSRVLEVGCGRGDLLASLKPSVGIGIDFSPKMVELARTAHPDLIFLEADAHQPPAVKQVDYVILSDLVNDLYDVQAVLQRIRPLMSSNGRLILNFHSRLWQAPLATARKLGLSAKQQTQNWLTCEDVDNLLRLADFEPIRYWTEILSPLQIPVVSGFCNRFLARLWPFRLAALTNFCIARPTPERGSSQPKVSVVIPCRNEAGNIADIFQRMPLMGRETELVFVEGHSTDDTYARLEAEIAAHPEWSCKLLRQTGKGKGDAVRCGFNESTGDILMILDSDLTMPPESLPAFYDALVSGKGEFINGVRLVYPMDQKAMRFFNLLGNKFFSWAFSWLLGQPIKDTLCGTKVLWKRDYEKIAAGRSYFGDFDPFGDFDLIFGAAKLSLKIVDLPIRYRERTYGTTNIQRWKHGMLLLRMVAFAARRLKFV